MNREEFPIPELTKEELIILQEIMNQERADVFNYHQDLLEQGQVKEAELMFKQYQKIKQIRNKLYHMTGRDTQAPGYHEQRWWDQEHDY